MRLARTNPLTPPRTTEVSQDRRRMEMGRSIQENRNRGRCGFYGLTIASSTTAARKRFRASVNGFSGAAAAEAAALARFSKSSGWVS